MYHIYPTTNLVSIDLRSIGRSSTLQLNTSAWNFRLICPCWYKSNTHEICQGEKQGAPIFHDSSSAFTSPGLDNSGAMLLNPHNSNSSQQPSYSLLCDNYTPTWSK